MHECWMMDKINGAFGGIRNTMWKTSSQRKTFPSCSGHCLSSSTTFSKLISALTLAINLWMPHILNDIFWLIGSIFGNKLQLTFNMGKSTEYSSRTIACSLNIIALSWFVYFRVKLLFSSGVAIWASVTTFTIPWFTPFIPMFHIWTWCGSEQKYKKIFVSKALC